jgi:hypothetical protein
VSPHLFAVDAELYEIEYIPGEEEVKSILPVLGLIIKPAG